MKLLHSFFCLDFNKKRICSQCDPVHNYHDIIVSIITALEAKDACTASHSHRVSDMTERFCLKLGLTATERNEIHMAAHVHDIGKIGIPDAILKKESSLEPDEWAIIKSHPEIGSNILSSSGRLENISRIVLHHHEKWNGSGYPYGLREEQIPLGARVIAICDSVDAMMSQRPYRSAMPEGRCKLEIISGIEAAYDPYLTKVFLDNWIDILSDTYSLAG